MTEFFGDNIVQILQTGFTGLSVLLMYMAYLLLRRQMDDSGEIERLKVNRTSIFGFLGFSALVMAGALYITIFPPVERMNVNMVFLPKKAERLKKIDISLAGVPQVVPTEDDGENRMGFLEGVKLERGKVVTFDLTGIDDDIRNLDQQQRSLKEAIEVLESTRNDLEKDKAALNNQLELFKAQTREDTLRLNNIKLSDSIIESESGA